MEARRRLATGLWLVGILGAGLGILIFKVPSLAEWKFLAWPAVLLGIAGCLGGFFVWRCRHCGSFPGPVTSSHCRQCGKALSGTEGPLVEKARLNRAIDPQAALRFKNALRRLEAIERFDRKSLGIAGTLGLVAAIALSALQPDWRVAGIGFLAVALFGWLLLHYGYVLARNAALVLLRCPACRKSLVHNRIAFCPHCGTPLPEPA